MWAANKRAGMPFSKLVNAAHHSQTISALFSLESLSNVLCVSFLVFFPPLLSSLFIFLSVSLPPLGRNISLVLIMEMFAGSRALLPCLRQFGRNKHADGLRIRRLLFEPVATKRTFSQALKLTPTLSRPHLWVEIIACQSAHYQIHADTYALLYTAINTQYRSA